MAIDAVNKDSGLEFKRRQIEQDRANELEKLESRRKSELDRIRQNEDRTIREAYGKSQEKIEESTSKIDDKLKRIEEAADIRIRDYERSTAQLAESAKRRYEEKAKLLERGTQDLENQRTQLERQHEAAMKNLDGEQAARRAEFDRRAKIDIERTALSRKQGVDRMKAEGDLELKKMEMDFGDRKQKLAKEYNSKINGLITQKEADRRHLELENESTKAALGDARNRLEAEYQLNESLRAIEHEDRIASLNNRAKHEEGQISQRGKMRIQDTKSQYDQSVYNIEREGEKKVRLSQDQYRNALERQESEAKFAQDMADKKFTMQRDIILNQRNEILDKNTKENEALYKKWQNFQAVNSKQVETDKKQQLETRLKAAQDAIKTEQDRHLKSLNSLTYNNIDALSKYQQKLEDPFYRAKELRPLIIDDSQQLLVKIKTNDHEQNDIKLSQANGKLTVGGTRRSQVRALGDDGRAITTNSYQSFTETIPYTGALNLKKAVRSYADGVLTFHIPKIV